MATAIKRGVATRAAGAVVKNLGLRALDTVRDAAGAVRERAATPLASRVRRLPIQLSMDIAVPVQVAWDEWMTLESLPEGMHRVEDIERDGDDMLVGRLSGAKVDDYWEAEILDEREDESFAWRSSGGSDCAGLITFHSLAERLTRLELELDVIPSRIGEAAGLALHLADRRAEHELRAFKARVERMSPDDYPPLDDEADDQEEMDE
ncbi:MAG TPA: SRPBCC family protein [Thermoleophilaceae bacterium]